jgi:hypothetical protein
MHRSWKFRNQRERDQYVTIYLNLFFRYADPAFQHPIRNKASSKIEEGPVIEDNHNFNVAVRPLSSELDHDVHVPSELMPSDDRLVFASRSPTLLSLLRNPFLTKLEHIDAFL